MSCKVSIVIPVHNAEKTIKNTIDAVLNQDYPKELLEVILIDDGSTDESSKIIEELLKLAPTSSVRYIPQVHAGPAAARNNGWKQARGEIICFTDSDCIPQEDWVSSLIRQFGSSDIGVVCGSYDITNKKSLLAQCIWREIRYRHSIMPDFPRSFGSYNFSARKEVLQKVGGFNETYTSASGEDNDLAYKILKAGFKIYLERSAQVKHHFPEKLSKYLHEQYQHGFWRMKLYRSYPKMVLGDDYTHFKDALEPMLVSGIIFLTIFIWINSIMALLPLGLLGFYIAWQFISALKICYVDKSFKYVYLAHVTFLRGITRTIGMWKGLWSLSSR